MLAVKLPAALDCKRCGHIWTPRVALVRICPRCKSLRWQTARDPNQRKRGRKRRGER